jgi:alkylation response protein AidB-like acyl-CoA dehydrogenase
MNFFALDEDLALARNTAARFAQERLAPDMRQHEAQRLVPPQLRSEFESLGLHVLDLAETIGGLGGGALGRAVINEELGSVDAGSAIALDRMSLALNAMARFGGAQAEDLAGDLAQDPDARALLVVVADDAFTGLGDRISLGVPWAPASRVDLLVLVNRFGACVVKQGIDLSAVRGAGLRAAGASELQLRNAPVAAHWADSEAATQVLAQAYLYAASLLVGVLRQGCDVARDYAMQREAFGQAIAQHQALAFLLVDMQMALETARLLVADAASRLDRDPADWGAAAAAFVECAEASRFIAPNAVQVLGGSGFMQDFPVEKVMREARLLGLWMGGVDRARDVSFEFLTGPRSRQAQT